MSESERSEPVLGQIDSCDQAVTGLEAKEIDNHVRPVCHGCCRVSGCSELGICVPAKGGLTAVGEAAELGEKEVPMEDINQRTRASSTIQFP
jgi:hypothetical protein